MDCFLLIALLISGISSPVQGQHIGDALYRCMACAGVLQQEFACTVNCDRTGRPYFYSRFRYANILDFLLSLY